MFVDADAEKLMLGNVPPRGRSLAKVLSPRISDHDWAAVDEAAGDVFHPQIPPLDPDSCSSVFAFVSEASQIEGQRALVIQKTKNLPRSAKVRRKAANGKRVARVHVELKKVPDRLDGDRALVAAAMR